MPINLEIKVALPSHKKVKSVLQELGAEFKGILDQKDIYYKSPSCLLKMRIIQNDRIELIKYNRVESGDTRWSNYEVILLSGKKVPGFFDNILKTETIVEKKRELWLYDNTRIHLDKVKGLGYFLELETLVLNGKKDAQKRFDFMVKVLNLDFDSQIRSSYRNLMKAKEKKARKGQD